MEKKKILITVSGGSAFYYADDCIDVCLIDYDIEPEAEIPEGFRYLLDGLNHGEINEC